MTLSREIVAAVDRLPAAPAEPCRVEAAAGPARLGLQLTHWSPVGYAFDQLDYRRDRDPAADLSAPELRAWGDRLAARLSYLMEPLVVLEVDDQAGEAELRSQKPTQRDALRSFYEVRLARAGTLRLRRVNFDTATRTRTVVPCQMTREALERLADDLDQTAAA